MMFLALASHVLEITLETTVESKFRLSTESSLEKLRAQSPIVIEERKSFLLSLSHLRTFLLKQMFSGKIERSTRKGHGRGPSEIRLNAIQDLSTAHA